MKHPAVCSLHQNTRTRLPTRQDRQGNSLICAPYSVLLPDCLKSCYVSDVMDEIEWIESRAPKDRTWRDESTTWPQLRPSNL